MSNYLSYECGYCGGRYYGWDGAGGICCEARRDWIDIEKTPCSLKEEVRKRESFEKNYQAVIERYRNNPCLRSRAKKS